MSYHLLLAPVRIFFVLWCMAYCGDVLAQSKRGAVEGVVVNAKGQVVFYAPVYVAGTNIGLYTDDNGRFKLKVPSEVVFSLVIQHSEYATDTIVLKLEAGETRDLGRIVLRESLLNMVRVSGEDEAIRGQVGTIQLEPESLQMVTTPFNDFSQKLASIGLGVVSNNELSSSYRVRGGSFDENLVYVNGIQVYRPFLARSGQQEGLGFINPGLVAGVTFSAGGWQARYGDKLSSVLDVEYVKPEKASSTVDIGLLGYNAQFSLASDNRRIRTINGFRYKSARYLFNTLPVQGEYLPRFADFQSYTSFDLSKKDTTGVTELGVLAHFSRNRYDVVPTTRSTDFGTFQESVRLTVAFDGDESYYYDTFQGGYRLTHHFGKKWKLDWTGSAMLTREHELINLESGYRICDVEKRIGSSSFNECILIRGVGTEFDYSRNLLEAQIFATELRTDYIHSPTFQMDFGMRATDESIDDQVYEYGFVDSADYVLDQSLFLIQADQAIRSQRVMGYAQATHIIDTIHTITYGVRANYWSYNGQLLISPRFQYSVAPYWRRDIVFSASLGIYQQPPFYREMRDFSGAINPNIRAQSSLHALAGLDWNYYIKGRNFKLIAEFYYKYLWNTIAYDVDNVRLRYYANNDARAFAVGGDIRLSGEFIENTESWLSIGFLRTMENLEFDNRGWVRRPSDQLVTFSMFFQDHIPSDPSIKLQIRYLFGSGLPYGPPNNVDSRTQFDGATTYNRVDFGISKYIDFTKRSIHSQKRFLKSISLTAELLNALGANNNLSFTWVKDFNNIFYAVPNSLSQRFFNARVMAQF